MSESQVVDQVKRGLELGGRLPNRYEPVDLTPDNHATKMFGVMADYGYAERLLFSDAYEDDARAISDILNKHARRTA